MHSFSQLLVPSAAANDTPMPNEITSAGEAVVGENCKEAAEAAKERRRRCSAKGGCFTMDAVVLPLDEEQLGKSVHTRESAKPLGAENRETQSRDVRQAGLPCGNRALPLEKLGGRVAAEATYVEDTGDIDEDTGAQWQTQQQAVEEFCLSVQTLRDAADEGLLKVEKRPNPYGATYAPMRLYRRCELQRLAIQIWGDETGVEKERERRREQRWQQRQQRTSGVLCESAARAASNSGAAATSRRSLPDLRSFLRSSSKRKKRRVQHSADGSSRCDAATRPVGGKATDNLSTLEMDLGRFAAPKEQYRAAENASAVTHEPVRSDEARQSIVTANAQTTSRGICERTHSICSQEIVWEEI